MRSAIVLAGGEGRRMGGGKPLATLDGRPLLAWALDAVRPLAGETLVAAGAHAAALAPHAAGARLLADAGEGPLRALALAAREARGAWLLVAPCDMPGLRAEDYARLLAAALGREGAVFDVDPQNALVAVYRRSALLDAVDRRLPPDARAPRDLLRAMRLARVPPRNPGALRGLDTREDLVREQERRAQPSRDKALFHEGRLAPTMTDSAKSAAPSFSPGLEGVVAAQTRLSLVDGQNGRLVIAGYPIEELARNATYEETVHLLWNDRLPSKEELEAFRSQLASLRTLPVATTLVLRQAASAKAPVIDALRMAAATLSLPAHGEIVTGDARRDAMALVARFPVVVAAYWRLLQGKEPLPSDPSLRLAANYLYQLTGTKPSEARTRAMETYLNTVVDHGLNASTFTARVITSTQSDLVSAITGALGALKGPLHGGAPGPALDMVFEIGTASRAEEVLRGKLARGERLMGFGHRVYKVRDPRADVLSAAAKTLFEADADLSLYELATSVEAVAIRLLDEHKPGRNLRTNVEFFTALLLHGLDLPTELFTPTFAVGRVGGWTAHAFEQQREGRLIRPQSVYVGPTDRKWAPVERR